MLLAVDFQPSKHAPSVYGYLVSYCRELYNYERITLLK